ncbi:aryl-sulfate sulfotransferase [bacterium]|nr:aryl-sulfate sulfotransferase [bacterium]
MRTQRYVPIPIILVSLFLSLPLASHAQSSAYEGYTLFNPNNSRTTYLVDMAGSTVHTWNHSRNGGYSVYLLPSGHLLRPCATSIPALRGAASAGRIEEVDWDGNLVWSFDYAGSTYVTHHDLEPMPNGNVLLIAWEVKSAAEATAMGRSSARTIWPDHIIEVQPDGAGGASIVWEWHAWDHLVQDTDPSKPNYGVISDHPERIDVNLGSNLGPGGGDWLHINGISYNPEKDQIVISSHFMNEIYVIDHSTTTAQAAGSTGGNAGKGGDLLYRWGQPSNYDAPGTDLFDVVHCSYWIPQGCPGAGHILAFNNNSRSRASVVTEIVPSVDQDGAYVLDNGAFGPAAPVWTYQNGSTFYSNHLGGNQRLPNGNTFITEATSGYLFEVDAQGNQVWDYNWHAEIARALRYGRDYPGVASLVSTGIEAGGAYPEVLSVSTYPNPFQSRITLEITTAYQCTVEVVIYNMLGRQIRRFEIDAGDSAVQQVTWNGRDADGIQQPSGIYLYTVRSPNAQTAGRIVYAQP